MHMSAAHEKHVGQTPEEVGSQLLVVRCTRELLERVATPATDEDKSTTALGDWFAQQVIVAEKPYILMVSRNSRLPLLIPGHGVDDIVAGLAPALEKLLVALDVAPESIRHEVAQCGDIVFSSGDVSSVRASANDFARRIAVLIADQPELDSTEVESILSEIPLKTLGFALPSEATRRLLE